MRLFSFKGTFTLKTPPRWIVNIKHPAHLFSMSEHLLQNGHDLALGCRGARSLSPVGRERGRVGSDPGLKTVQEEPRQVGTARRGMLECRGGMLRS